MGLMGQGFSVGTDVGKQMVLLGWLLMLINSQKYFLCLYRRYYFDFIDRNCVYMLREFHIYVSLIQKIDRLGINRSRVKL